MPRIVRGGGGRAVKQYAWFYALRGPRQASDGRCFDVRDGTSDQLYKPHRSRVRADQILRIYYGPNLQIRT